MLISQCVIEFVLVDFWRRLTGPNTFEAPGQLSIDSEQGTYQLSRSTHGSSKRCLLILNGR